MLVYYKKDKSELIVMMQDEVKMKDDVIEAPKIQFAIDEKKIELSIEEAVMLGHLLINTALAKWDEFLGFRERAINMAISKSQELNYVG